MFELLVVIVSMYLFAELIGVLREMFGPRSDARQEPEA